MSKQPYDKKFYQHREKVVSQSADEILAIVFDYFKPSSVIDLGCATGIWLQKCKKLGSSKVLGIDGKWVDMSTLQISKNEFQYQNLAEQPYLAEERYDLAISIEVAEHLPERMGVALVDSLVKASDHILFSAAVEGQGGTGHINEQKQSYWAKQFANQGYVAVDFIRKEIWDNPKVNIIYKQNIILYVKGSICRNSDLEQFIIEDNYSLDRIHPDLFTLRIGNEQISRFKGVLRGLRIAIQSLFSAR